MPRNEQKCSLFAGNPGSEDGTPAPTTSTGRPGPAGFGSVLRQTESWPPAPWVATGIGRNSAATTYALRNPGGYWGLGGTGVACPVSVNVSVGTADPARDRQ